MKARLVLYAHLKRIDVSYLGTTIFCGNSVRGNSRGFKGAEPPFKEKCMKNTWGCGGLAPNRELEKIGLSG